MDADSQGRCLGGFIVVADEICCLSGVARQLVTFF